MFSFAIIGSTAATTLKLVNNARKLERLNFVFKCKKLLVLHLVWKTNLITVRETIFHYAINSFAYLKNNLPKYGRAITKFFLGTVFTTGFGASILSKNSLIHFVKILFNFMTKFDKIRAETETPK